MVLRLGQHLRRPPRLPRIGISPFAVEFDFESPRVVLLSFDSRDPNPPILATPVGPVLHLNVGDRAHLRTHGDTDDRAEEYHLRMDDGTLFIDAFNRSISYETPALIIGHANLRGDLLSAAANVPIPVHFSGGPGYDILRGGSGNDTLEGGDGPDFLNGRDGANTLRGGDDNDTLISGSSAIGLPPGNVLDGGEGTDTVHWLNSSLPVTIDLRTGFLGGGAMNDTLISIERYKGSPLDDTIDGSENDDLLLAGQDGDDVIRGHGGNDVLDGGHGDDTLEGGEGDDFLEGGPGADHIDGGPGTDTLSYLKSRFPVTASLLTGTATRGDAEGDTFTNIEILLGSDIFSNAGFPNFPGHENDLTPATSGDILTGGPGNDIIHGMAGSDTLHGGDGNDTLHGGDGDDTLNGNAGDDHLDGGPGDDHLIALDLEGIDHLHGGEGHNRLSADYSDKTTPLHFTVGEENSHTFPDGDQFHNFQTLGTLHTGPADDIIRLASGPEPAYFPKTIHAGPGDDIVIADSRYPYPLGNNIYTRSPDHLHGGEGNDWISFEQSISGVTIDLSTNATDWGAANMTISGFENAIGSDFADILTAHGGGSILDPRSPAYNGDGTVAGADSVRGGGGVDTLRVDYSSDPWVNAKGILMEGSWTAWTGLVLGPNWQYGNGRILSYYNSAIERFDITGGDADDTFHGRSITLSGSPYEAHNDRFIGRGGNDRVFSQRGDDYIDGGEGDDTLNAGIGHDTVLGGPGNDTIVFEYEGGASGLGYGHDICDAGPGDDTVSNISVGFQSDSTNTNATTLMQLDGGEGFDILNADLGNLTNSVTIDDALPIPAIDLPNGGYIRNFERFHSLVLGSGHDTVTLRGRLPVTRSLNLREGNDTLRVGTGFVHALGGAGTDTLILDLSQGDDPGISGLALQGNIFGRRDTVTNTVVDRYQLYSFEHIHFTGSSKNDTLTASSFGGFLASTFFGHGGDDTITGGSGNDWIDGGEGNDTLNGASGSDWIDGGPGADTMTGASGNDTYIVDDPGDIVSEANDSIFGNDTVRASIDYTLPSGVENLVLTGSATTGTGNTGHNRLTGNSRPNHLRGESGNDILDGRGGPKIDRLHGGAGADTFILGAAGHRYYDDGDPATPGHHAYALIEDFTPHANPSSADRLQLAGTPAEYHLAESPFGDIPGTALYHDTNANGEPDPATDELIAILQSAAALTRANTLVNATYTQPLAPAAIGLAAPLQPLLLPDPHGQRFAAEFQIDGEIPATARLEIQTSTDLGLSDPWLTIAAKTGNAAWTGPVALQSTAEGKVTLRVTALHTTPATPTLFLRLLIHE